MRNQVHTILQTEENSARRAQLSQLREQDPEGTLQALVSLLEDPLESIRRRAGSALSLFNSLHPGPVTVERHVETLARILEEGTDPRVRLSCAILLMPIRHPAADRAYRSALRDSSEKVVQLACLEMSARANTDGVQDLRALLHGPSWTVRLEACKALMTLKAVDQQVVDALEALRTDPQATVHDAETVAAHGDLVDMLKTLAREEAQEDPEQVLWGTLDEILAKARQLLNHGRD